MKCGEVTKKCIINLRFALNEIQLNLRQYHFNIVYAAIKSILQFGVDQRNWRYTLIKEDCRIQQILGGYNPICDR